jgi:dinuclear metal center YbgI/SA1388 family protein
MPTALRPAKTTDVLDFLDELLEPEAFDDYGPNGLQVPGAVEVDKIVTGVSAQLALFERAASERAQLVLAHHGILWDFHPRRIAPVQAARLKQLLVHDIALAAYHLPLDAHPQVGNNALIAEGLGANGREPFAIHGGRPIGTIAHFAPDDGGVPAQELFARVATLTDRQPLVFDAGPPRIRTLGIVSGAAAKDLPEAIARGLDAFLTGEPSEHVMADAREAGIHFIAAGHYATETFGIRRIGELVAERFGIEHVFVDIPNPV